MGSHSAASSSARLSAPPLRLLPVLLLLCLLPHPAHGLEVLRAASLTRTASSHSHAAAEARSGIPPTAPRDYSSVSDGTGYTPNPKWPKEIRAVHPWHRRRYPTGADAMEACALDMKCGGGGESEPSLCQPLKCAVHHINCEPTTTLACKIPRTCHDDLTQLCEWCYRC